MWLGACTSPKNVDYEGSSSIWVPSISTPTTDTLPELTEEQNAAFESLNQLQVSTDKINQLYSTLAGVNQPCYPPDSTFTLSQSDLLLAMRHFVNTHCTNLSDQQREELATKSVLAQKEYLVYQCMDNPIPAMDSNAVIMTGTWLLPKILNRRDVIIVW